MKATAEQIIQEIKDRIVDNESLMVEHDNNQDVVHELESAINELKNLLEWINE